MGLMPRIFDCFTFFNEQDVAAIRFEELGPVVDYFVIVEAAVTFRGNPKAINFDSDKFKKQWRHKFIHVTIDELPGKTPWEREIYQRNFIATAIKDLTKPDDTIIISDADEIPRHSVVKPVDREHRLLIDKYSYGINMLTDEGNSSVRMLPYRDIGTRTMEEIRRGDAGELIHNAGWEFSSLGTPADIMTKFKSFSHTEFDEVISESIFAERMARGEDLLGRNIKMTPVEIDDTWPEAIKNNRDYWSRYEWKA